MTNKPIWNKTEKEQNNFLARIIGIFGEQITSYWLNDENCNYKNLGRPTLHWQIDGKKKWTTLDFLIKHKKNNKIFLVEQKNFFAYQNGKFKTINNGEFIKHYQKWSDGKMKSNAWRLFNEIARDIDNQKDYEIKTKNGEYYKLDGTILIWSDVIEKDKFLELTKFNDVIGLTKIIKDLNRWKNKEYTNYLNEKQCWINELFSWLRNETFFK